MQKEGEVTLLQMHCGGASVCAFHPKDRHLFISGGDDGKVQVSSALLRKQIRSIKLGSASVPRALNGLAFMTDEEKIVTSCVSRRMSVIDIERGEPVITYENCVCPSLGRQPMSTHSEAPHLVASLTVNGKGITLFDLRMPLPLDFIVDLYDTSIGDVSFLGGSWPFSPGHVSLVSGGSGDSIKVSNLGGRTLHRLPSPSPVSTLAPSPGHFKEMHRVFPSVITCGGESLSAHIPKVIGGIGPSLASLGHPFGEVNENFKSSDGWVLRAKYSPSGGVLYTATQGGSIVRYRRYPSHHLSQGRLYSHDGPITDMDISTYGEFLISACQDGKVGLLTLGGPSHGWTQCWELT